jgi:hypothetical protein
VTRAGVDSRDDRSPGERIAGPLRGGFTMRRKLMIALFAVAAVSGTAALLAPTAAVAGSCPKNSHLIVCPTYSFCCPNNAFCVCFP